MLIDDLWNINQAKTDLIIIPETLAIERIVLEIQYLYVQSNMVWWNGAGFFLNHPKWSDMEHLTQVGASWDAHQLCKKKTRSDKGITFISLSFDLYIQFEFWQLKVTDFLSWKEASYFTPASLYYKMYIVQCTRDKILCLIRKKTPIIWMGSEIQ